MSTIIQPFDLETLLVSRLVGLPSLFVFFSLIVITFLAARFKMQGGTLAVIISVYVILMSASETLVGEVQWLIVLIAIGTTAFIGFSLGRLFN